jgi:hypothetical protein
MRSRFIVLAVIAGLTLEGCSSRPREFTPTLAVAADQAGFDTALATCKQLLVEGKLDSNGRSGSAGAGAAAGAATAAVGGTTAAAVGGYAGLAAMSATIILLPFAVLGGAWGMSKMKRAQKERAIKAALGGCLAERGYAVMTWQKASKRAPVTHAAPAVE